MHQCALLFEDMHHIRFWGRSKFRGLVTFLRREEGRVSLFVQGEPEREGLRVLGWKWRRESSVFLCVAFFLLPLCAHGLTLHAL